MKHDYGSTPLVHAKSRIELSVVIPFFNCSNCVSEVLDRIGLTLRKLGVSYEIIAVNDGSSDNTSTCLMKEIEKDRHITLCSYEKNMGKGYAIRYGIRRSHGEIVIFIDGDLDVSPDAICEYIKALNDCDLVIASKRHPLSKIRMSATRKILSKLFNFLVRSLTGIRLSDTQTGLKVGDGNVLRDIFSVMRVNSYAFDVEFLTASTLLGLRIKEMPVELSIENKFRLTQILQMLIDLLAIAYRFKIRREFESLKVRIDLHRIRREFESMKVRIEGDQKAEIVQLVKVQIQEALNGSATNNSPEIKVPGSYESG